jgi:hypothetical protein
MRSAREPPVAPAVHYHMKRVPYTAGLVAVSACLALGSAAAHSAPRAIKATYSASMSGMSIGTMAETFETEGSTYRIVSESKPMGLAALLLQRQPLRFTSRGQLTNAGLRPALFEGRRTANDPPMVSAEFDWANGHVQLRHNGKLESVPLVPGTQDRLSIMYQYMYVRLDKLRQIDFAMTNGRRLRQYRYRITPDVEIDTALGRLKTLHLVKQHEPGDNHAEAWLSPQHQNLAVKMLIVERDGVRYEQLIQSLELRD